MLRKFIEETALPAYNSTPGCVPMNLVLFREAIEHVARIARVISQPKGNMLVVGIGMIYSYIQLVSLIFQNLLVNTIHYEFVYLL